MDVQFRNLASLHWLWLLLVVLAVVVVGLVMRRRRMLRFATAAVLSRLTPSASPARRGLRFGLLIAAMFMLVVALLDPRWGISYEDVRDRTAWIGPGSTSSTCSRRWPATAWG
jgi:hypothetical protein